MVNRGYMQSVLTLGIVGFGFSGLCTLFALVTKAKVPFRVYVFDVASAVGKGVAFATEDPKHLLNVRASQMGAMAENPNDFYEWLCDNEKFWRPIDPYFQSLQVLADSFLPRKLYGIYLEQVFLSICKMAKDKNIDLIFMGKKALDASCSPLGEIRLIVEGGGCVLLDKLIIATGVPTSKKFPFESSFLINNDRYISDIWSDKERFFSLSSSKEKGSIVIIGTGLTMIDAVTTLQSNQYQGKIIAISTKGLLPEYHLKEASFAISSDYTLNLPSKLLLLFKKLKKDVQSAISSKSDFRPYIDAIRPLEVGLWKQFTGKEKQLFLKYLFGVWNKYRHRMSFESFVLLKQLQERNILQILPGSIQSVDPYYDKLIVHYEERQSKKIVSIKASYVIKCCGPQYDITKQDSLFIHNLHSKGLVDFDQLDLGLALTQEGAIQGKAHNKIYALGSLLFGELFETTAVPEIRNQASAIAEKILQC